MSLDPDLPRSVQHFAPRLGQAQRGNRGDDRTSGTEVQDAVGAAVGVQVGGDQGRDDRDEATQRRGGSDGGTADRGREEPGEGHERRGRTKKWAKGLKVAGRESERTGAR